MIKVMFYQYFNIRDSLKIYVVLVQSKVDMICWQKVWIVKVG